MVDQRALLLFKRCPSTWDCHVSYCPQILVPQSSPVKHQRWVRRLQWGITGAPLGFASPLLSHVYSGSLRVRVLQFPVWRWSLASSARAGAQLGGLEPGASSSPSHSCVLTAPSPQIYFHARFVGIKEPDKKYVFNSNVTDECRGSWYRPLSKSRGGMSIICLLPASLNWLSFRGGKKPQSLLAR